ncbi:unnamed protein product [Paramecium primaurelia]|uniref:Uncharacterized protein n=2 Tax=Paramecium TaxID=5884 RepID=A0A8S1TW17_9CILI|nr:unnamed protein product [Paramecium primaurelia]CAD8156184.1 unnamed protein product [Paramecium pentaurelia]
MNSNNSTVSHLSENYETKYYPNDQEKENKNIQIPTFIQYYELNNTTTLNTITQKLTNTISQIQETENSLYETLQKTEITEEQKQQIKIRIIKLQMLQVIAQFKTETKSNLSALQRELREIQNYILNELLQF